MSECAKEYGKKNRIECSEENAPAFLMWIRERGGVALWRSANLANPGASWCTPRRNADGVEFNKPTWEAESVPEIIVTDPEEIDVKHYVEVKRFHVAVRRGGDGLSFKLTDASSRKVRDSVNKAGEDAHYVFDYDSQEAVILKSDKTTTLAEWAKKNEPREEQEQS